MATGAEASPSTTSELLKSVLKPAYETRWLADFLFTDLSKSTFHTTLPLHPQTFQTLVATDITQTVTLKPDPLYPPAAAHGPLPKELIKDMPEDTVDETVLHALYMPIAALGPHTVGYVLCAHAEDMPNCMPHNPLVPPFKARFSFDARTQTLLTVIRGGRPHSIAIRAVRYAHAQPMREQFNFVIPDAPYAWPALPTTVTWMLSFVEVEVAARVPQTPSRALARTFHSLFETSACVRPERVDAAPWPVGLDGVLTDGLRPDFCEGSGNDTSVTAFTASTRSHANQSLSNFLKGDFQSPGFRIDALEGMSGRFSSACTGGVRLLHTVTKDLCVDILRRRFLSDYFACVLAVSADGGLSALPEACASGSRLGICVNGRRRRLVDKQQGRARWEDCPSGSGREPTCTDSPTGTGSALVPRGDRADVGGQAVRIEKRPSLMPVSMPVSMPVDNMQGAEAGRKETCEDMLQARRKRNRLSAARSNEKKRVWMAKLEQDVRAARLHVEELTRRRDVARRENNMLKVLVAQHHLPPHPAIPSSG